MRNSICAILYRTSQSYDFAYYIPCIRHLRSCLWYPMLFHLLPRAFQGQFKCSPWTALKSLFRCARVQIKYGRCSSRTSGCLLWPRNQVAVVYWSILGIAVTGSANTVEKATCWYAVSCIQNIDKVQGCHTQELHECHLMLIGAIPKNSCVTCVQSAPLEKYQ